MTRGSSHSKGPFRVCDLCDRRIGSRGFAKHYAACQPRHTDAEKGPIAQAPLAKKQRLSTPERSQDDVQGMDIDPEVQTIDSDDDQPASNSGPSAPGQLQPQPAASTSSAETYLPHGPWLPEVYIHIVHHPHSGLVSQIISLDNISPQDDEPPPEVDETRNPWAPFRSYADFTFAERAVQSHWSNTVVDSTLQSLHGEWTAAQGSTVSFKSHRDLQESLTAARKYIVEFKTGAISIPYKGQARSFTFQYRDPWEWMLSLLQDPTLKSSTHLFSMRKFYCDRTRGIWERLIDEPWTADSWNAADDSMPSSNPFPHCYAPILGWLDKTGVSETKSMHPILGRGLWLPEAIRNASGNGGGVLFGFMPIVTDPDDPDNTGTGDDDFGVFKRTVYQAVLDFIFSTLRDKSHSGWAIQCNDGVSRIIYPGILIVSLDAEEAAIFCACKSHNATVPCPKCLVRHDKLSAITQQFEARSTVSMMAALGIAREPGLSKAAKNEILLQNGLHDVEHFMWRIARSDPYQAYSYDMLHSDELGKWAHHLWILVKAAVNASGWTSKVNDNMSRFPRWRGLKHFIRVMDVKFGDGQKHLDVLKSIVPVIAQVLPGNSALVNCVRAYIKFRMLVGCHCMSESRLQALRNFIGAYEMCCRDVSKKHDKNFNFIKQHQMSHVVPDIQSKGVSSNFVTRPGEGFQQEVKQMYRLTNFREVEEQMTTHDANAEAIAFVRMHIDLANESHAGKAIEQESDAAVDDDEEGDDGDGDLVQLGADEAPWQLGAGERKWMHIGEFLQAHPSLVFASFEADLRTFLMVTYPKLASKCSGSVQIQAYHCLYVHFQSQDDYRLGRDILRCTATWYGGSRYDCVIYQDGNTVKFARLRALLRCKLMNDKIVDVVVVSKFKPASWKPKTFWDGCEVREEERQWTFLAMEDIVRGALLCPAFQAPRETLHYVIDTVDEDMFLRLNSL